MKRLLTCLLAVLGVLSLLSLAEAQRPQPARPQPAPRPKAVPQPRLETLIPGKPIQATQGNPNSIGTGLVGKGSELLKQAGKGSKGTDPIVAVGKAIEGSNPAAQAGMTGDPRGKAAKGTKGGPGVKDDGVARGNEASPGGSVVIRGGDGGAATGKGAKGGAGGGVTIGGGAIAGGKGGGSKGKGGPGSSNGLPEEGAVVDAGEGKGKQGRGGKAAAILNAIFGGLANARGAGGAGCAVAGGGFAEFPGGSGIVGGLEGTGGVLAQEGFGGITSGQDGPPAVVPQPAEEEAKAVPQTRRYLVLKNDSAKDLKVFVQYRARTEDGAWLWVPADPDESEKALVIDVPAGKSVLVEHDGRPMSSSRVRMWSVAGEQVYDEYKGKDLWLVPETDEDGQHVYLAPQIGVFTFVFPGEQAPAAKGKE